MSKLKALEQQSKKIQTASSKIRKFLESLLDNNSFVELDVFTSGTNFIDGTEALGEGVVTGYASINDVPIYLFAQNQDVLKGSFSKAHGDKIIKVLNLAIKNNTPLIAVIDSNGARIGDGISVIEAYSSVINAATIASEQIPLISIIKGNCVGLMSSIPVISDYVFMSEDGTISLSSPNVVVAKANSSSKPTELLGSKIHMLTSGMANCTFKDANDLSSKLKDVVMLFNGNEIDSEDDPNRVTPALNMSISTKAIIDALSDKGKFIPYSTLYAPELLCGFVSINGISCAVAVSDSSVSLNLSRAALIKLNKFVEILDKFNIPFISLVDSAGVEADLILEQNGLSREYMSVMKSISISGMPKVAVICGKAIGNAYSLLASKSIGYDYVLAFANAEITPIEASVAVNLMYVEELKAAKDPIKAREELSAKYSALQGDPMLAAKEGYIDNVIEPSTLRPYVASALLMLLGL